jgi:hydroxypyruvate reductase
MSSRELPRPTQILAVGKAATAMFEGLPREWRNSVPTYLVTKTGHIGDTILEDNVVALETSHPVPDQSSLDAGKGALDFVAIAGTEVDCSCSFRAAHHRWSSI